MGTPVVPSREASLDLLVFDEQASGVKRRISTVVADAHRAGRKVGICGQAPSDHPEFAEFLMLIGIGMISLTPDALPGRGVAALRSGRSHVRRSHLVTEGQDAFVVAGPAFAWVVVDAVA